MLLHITAISSLLLGIAFFLLGNSLLGTLLQLKGISETYTTVTIGFFMSAYYAGFFAGNWVTMPVIRRIGHIRAFALFASLACVSALLHILIINPGVWIALRFIYGISAISIYIIVESWLNTQAPNALRGRIFAIYMVINFMAQAAGQQLLRLDQTLGFVLFAVAAICISSSLTPIMLTRRMQPPPPAKRSSNLRALMRTTPLPLLASCASGLSSGAFWGMGSAYMSLKGFDMVQIATTMTATILGGALFQYPMGRFSDRFDRRKVLLGVTCGAAVASLAIIFSLSDSWLPWIFFFWGGFSFCIYPIAVAQLIDQLKVEDMLSGTTSLLLINGIGAMTAPILAGLLMKPFGPSALPYLFLSITSALAIYTFYRIRYASDHVTDAPAQFVPMTRTSRKALEIMTQSSVDSDTPATNLQQSDTPRETTDVADSTQKTDSISSIESHINQPTAHEEPAPAPISSATSIDAPDTSIGPVQPLVPNPEPSLPISEPEQTTHTITPPEEQPQNHPQPIHTPEELPKKQKWFHKLFNKR